MNTELHFTDNAPDIASAYQACRQLANDSYENFNIGSLLIKHSLRPHFYSIYAFCRLIDDLGDEVDGDRLTLIDRWEDELIHCYDGKPNLIWFQALQHTIQKFNIPIELFQRLIEANRRDQRDTEYADFEALKEYCTYSATPVGHLVLYLYGYFSEHMAELSDHTCIALQLANFWQDVARDFDKGRLYIPKSDMAHFGVEVTTIQDRKPTRKFRDLMKFQVDRTREMFREGYELYNHLQRDLKLEFSAITAGGLSILDSIKDLDYDTLTVHPTVSRVKKLHIMISIVSRKILGLSPISSRAFRNLR